MIYPTRCGVKIVPAKDDLLTVSADSADAVPALILRDLAGSALLEVPADGAWTIERLVGVLDSPRACECVADAFGADVFIGREWIGGTEV